jgi:hypothetical protein
MVQLSLLRAVSTVHTAQDIEGAEEVTTIPNSACATNGGYFVCPSMPHAQVTTKVTLRLSLGFPQFYLRRFTDASGQPWLWDCYPIGLCRGVAGPPSRHNS